MYLEYNTSSAANQAFKTRFFKFRTIQAFYVSGSQSPPMVQKTIRIKLELFKNVLKLIKKWEL